MNPIKISYASCVFFLFCVSFLILLHIDLSSVSVFFWFKLPCLLAVSNVSHLSVADSKLLNFKLPYVEWTRCLAFSGISRLLFFFFVFVWKMGNFIQNSSTYTLFLYNHSLINRRRSTVERRRGGERMNCFFFLLFCVILF